MSTTHLSCRCGACRFKVEGAPILTVDCQCTSCRRAADRIAALPGGADDRAATGGLPYALFRKDRVTATGEGWAEMRLTAKSPTRRVIATCCNTFMALDFSKGHWLSVPTARWPDGQAPAPELRTMCKDRTDPAPLPDDIPNPGTHTAAFMVRLVAAWAKMGFRSPKILPDLPAVKEPDHV